MACHLPFVMPVAGLLLFAVLPLPVALGLYVPLVALSVAIGIPANRALSQPIPLGGPALRAAGGVVVSAEGRAALVRWESELWNAVADEPLAPGDRVAIVELRGLTAVVRRAGRGDRPESGGSVA